MGGAWLDAADCEVTLGSAPLVQHAGVDRGAWNRTLSISFNHRSLLGEASGACLIKIVAEINKAELFSYNSPYFSMHLAAGT